ncbi:hypothetical protein ABKN59_011675 [Abortiporus biennis]
MLVFTIQKPFTEQVRKNLLIIYGLYFINIEVYREGSPLSVSRLQLHRSETFTLCCSVVFISHLKTQNSNNQNRIANARRPSVSNYRKKIDKYFYF